MVSGGSGIRYFPRSTPLQLEQEQVWTVAAPALPVELPTRSEVEFSLAEIAECFHLLEMDAEEGTRLEVSYDLPQGRRAANAPISLVPGCRLESAATRLPCCGFACV